MVTDRSGREDARERLARMAGQHPAEGGWVPPPPVLPSGAEYGGPHHVLGSVGTTDGSGDRDEDRSAVTGSVALEGRAIRARALDSAITAYTAAHGHPLDHAGAEPALRRWATRARVVVAAALVLAATTGIVVARAFGQLPSTVVESGAGGVESVVRAGADDAGSGSEGSPGQEGDTADAGTAAAGAGADAVAEQQVIVHVVGQVNDPGLVHLDAGARVAEAIEAAGGPTAEADLAALNLARVLTDGEQVRVPLPGEQVPAAAPGGTEGVGPGTGDAVLDLNTADVEALDALPGIGPVLAQRIVDWRTEHGRFTTVDELGEVTGIGSAVLADLRDLVRV